MTEELESFFCVGAPWEGKHIRMIATAGAGRKAFDELLEGRRAAAEVLEELSVDLKCWWA